MAILDASLEQTTDLIARGVKEDLAKSIEKKFHEQIDPLIKELALDYAEKITVKVRSMRMNETNAINMQVVFNSEELKG